MKTILVATNFSEHSRLAVSYAAELSVQFGAELIVTHVDEGLSTLSRGVSPFTIRAVQEMAAEQRRNAQRELDDLAARMREAHGLRARALLRAGKAYVEIVAFARAEQADVL